MERRTLPGLDDVRAELKKLSTEEVTIETPEVSSPSPSAPALDDTPQEPAPFVAASLDVGDLDEPGTWDDRRTEPEPEVGLLGRLSRVFRRR